MINLFEIFLRGSHSLENHALGRILSLTVEILLTPLPLPLSLSLSLSLSLGLYNELRHLRRSLNKSQKYY